MKITLFNYYRSSASWRVRIAFAAKKIPYEYSVVNILNGEHKLQKYLDINPSALVPSILVEGYQKEPIIITQSMAIIEFLDNIDQNPIFTPPPHQLIDRIKMMEIVNTITCDTHPLQNVGVLMTYPEGTRKARANSIVTKSLTVIEELLKRNHLHREKKDSLRYSVSDQLTLADIVLIPQVYNSITRFGVKLEDYPHIEQIYKHVIQLEPFVLAHPDNQPDAPPKQQK